MNVLGLIPARGGSKGIPQKNIASLDGRPMLAYTAEAALASKRITRAILSTNDEQIAKVGRECGIEVPFLRPPELARDDTPSLPVAQHAVRWLEEREGWKADVLVLLQPTSPLRRADHIDQALARMEELGADTVVSVVEVPHRFSPYSVMRMENGVLKDFWNDPLPFDRFRRQSAPVLYARNGPAVLACRTQVLFERSGFYGERIAPFEMSEEDSADVDTPLDLRLAAFLLSERRK